jgi:plasmid maintenance system killer protein
MHPSGALHLLEHDENKYYTSRTNSNASICMKYKQGSKDTDFATCNR